MAQSTFPAKPLAITMGDAAGIGPEIIAKAYAAQAAQMQASFVAGDVQAMRHASALVAEEAPSLAWPVVQISDPQEALHLPPRCIAVLQVGAPMQPVPYGQVSAVAGEFACRCVQWAAQQALDGAIAAVVTAPLNKQSLSAAGPLFAGFPGHTEMLQALAARHAGLPVARLPVRMMLANEELRTVLVSIHLSLRQRIYLTIDTAQAGHNQCTAAQTACFAQCADVDIDTLTRFGHRRQFSRDHHRGNVLHIKTTCSSGSCLKI